MGLMPQQFDAAAFQEGDMTIRCKIRNIRFSALSTPADSSDDAAWLLEETDEHEYSAYAVDHLESDLPALTECTRDLNLQAIT